MKPIEATIRFTDRVRGIPVNMDPIILRWPDRTETKVPRKGEVKVKKPAAMLRALEHDGWDVEGDFPSVHGERPKKSSGSSKKEKE